MTATTNRQIIPLQQTVHKVVCPHDCPDTCSMLAYVEDGRVVRVGGDPDHPLTQGFLCAKTNRYYERIYSPDRMLYPMRRKPGSPKGPGSEFERISWDDAIAAIVANFQRVIAEHGPEAVLPYSYAGTMGIVNYGSMDNRLFHRMGASLLDRTICSTAGEAAMKYTIGGNYGYDPEEVSKAEMVIIWGANIASTHPHPIPFIKEAQRRGARVVLIDPHRSRSASLADQVIMLRPGTDAAFALGMMNVIINEGLYDEEYVEQYTHGFEQLRERVQQYPVERAAQITGIEAEVITELARAYAAAKPAAIRLGYGMQRHTNGGMAVRTVYMLPALVGHWRYAGGGTLLSTGHFVKINWNAVERPDLIPQGHHPRTINMNELGEALLTADNPPVKALYVYNCNPASVTPDQTKVLQGLRRPDLFVAVHEQLWTDTTDYADVVMPATTSFEHTDLYKAYGHLYVQLSEPAIAPVGESKPNIEVFRMIAKGMGYTEPCFDDDEREIIGQALSAGGKPMEGITWDKLKEGPQRIRTPRPFAPFARGGFATASGKCEFYSEQMAAAGLDPLPNYTPIAESPDGSPELHQRYPLNLISPAAHHFLNSSFSNLERSQRGEVEPTIELSEADAAARGIATGDWCRVFNARGEVRLRAKVGDTVRPGVACTLTIWWTRDTPDHTGINVLTSDRLTDMGGGATFHTNLVQVAKAD